jgi:hypothetical protein
MRLPWSRERSAFSILKDSRAWVRAFCSGSLYRHRRKTIPGLGGPHDHTQGALGYPSIEGFGPQSAEQVANLSTPGRENLALLAGFDLDFYGDDNSDDPQLHMLQMELNSQNLSPYAVEVTGALGVRDRSNQWDDNYGGVVHYVVVAAEAGEELLGGSVAFPPAAGAGPRSINETVRFGTDVQAAVAVLRGFVTRFTTSDHPLQQLEVDVDGQQPGPRELQVTGTYALRDASNTWDDTFDGSIHYGVLGGSQDGRLKARTGRLEFPPLLGQGPREDTLDIDFGRPIGVCAAALTGFTVAFADGHHDIRRVVVLTEARKMSSSEAQVRCILGLRDKSSDWDDEYYGSVRFAVVATA